MAILGSLSAYLVYRVIAGSSAIKSPRRVVAAAVSGYVAINLSALATAFELGIQPLLFHDAAGAPLYAPYPLRIAIPAMMIGHLSIAGMAEMIVAAGVVTYLQRSEPTLLYGTAPGLQAEDGKDLPPAGWGSTRPLWFAIAFLMLATPLGILAAGTAWSEWSVSDFKDLHTRQQIASSSGGHALPTNIPAGLAKLSSFWTAPMPAYAPAFLKSTAFGYLLSAMLGTGLILLAFLIAGRMLCTRGDRVGSEPRKDKVAGVR
jgi:cobalt/nickel transport system permease protein